jgi:SAM-dependent methyltransferase
MIRGLLNYVKRYATGGAAERGRVRYELGLRLRRIDHGGVSLETLGFDPDRSKGYYDSGGPDLQTALRSLEIPPATVALDLGCGKAGAMLTLAAHCARVDGVDLSPELVRIAQANLARAGLSAKTRVFCCDAAEFRDLDAYGLIYMFNPFPEKTMRAVAENLSASATRAPRNLIIVYKNPRQHAVLTETGFSSVREIDCGDRLPFRIYRYSRAASPADAPSCD